MAGNCDPCRERLDRDQCWNGAGDGGSGDSIWLTAKKIDGSGTIQAKGGDGLSFGSGGGSGGRIAVYADTLVSTISISTAGGSGYGSGGSGSTHSAIDSGTPVPTPDGTDTPTPTPGPTLTPTLTRTPKATATAVPGTTADVATFTYDGDGKMVKAIVNGVTTIYVSSSYQIKDGVVTKYYPGGAMRVGSTLSYVLADHLSSSSLTLDASGAKIAEMRYKPWGEVRYQDGTLPTDRTYTGQRSYTSDFGLMYYNARWYDSSIGRFAQADTIIPGGVQGYDRYAYANNNSVNSNDPSGHSPCDSMPDGSAKDACNQSKYWTQSTTNPLPQGVAGITEMIQNTYGVTIDGSWTLRNISILRYSMLKMDAVLNGHLKDFTDGATISYGAYKQTKKNCDEGKICTYDGLTEGKHLTFRTTNNGPIYAQNIYHEFGHLLDNVAKDKYTTALRALKNPSFVSSKADDTKGYLDRAAFINPYFVNEPNLPYTEVLQHSYSTTTDVVKASEEQWGDIFANYVIGNINLDTTQGADMNTFISTYFP